MITAAVSTVLGMVGGILPEVMKEVRDSRNASREREFLKLQAELQLQAASPVTRGRGLKRAGRDGIVTDWCVARHTRARIETSHRHGPHSAARRPSHAGAD